MRHALRTWLVAVFASIGCGTAERVVAPASGMVRDGHGRPVARARVTLEAPVDDRPGAALLAQVDPPAPPIAVALSGEDGTWQVLSAPPGPCILVARADGFATAVVADLRLADGDPLTDIDVRLVADEPMLGRFVREDEGVIANREVAAFLRDEEDGRVVPPTVLGTTTTAADGSFTLRGVAGACDVGVRADDGVSWWIERRKTGTETVEILGGGLATLAATVVQRNGTPVAGARVIVFGGGILVGTTGADGKCDVAGVSTKSALLVAVVKDGFAASFDDAAMLASPVGPRALRPGRRELIYLMDEGRTLAGTVVSSTDGAPVAGVRVRLISLQSMLLGCPRATTDASGRFQFAHQGELPSLAVIDDPNWCSTAEAMTLPPRPESFHRPGSSEIRLRAVRRVAVTGTVCDTEGRPVAGARVGLAPRPVAKMSIEEWFTREIRIASEPAPVRTDAAGAFKLLVAAGDADVSLHAVHGRFESPARAIARVRGAAPPRVEFVLGRDVSIEGRVLDSDGAPLGDALVTPLVLPYPPPADLLSPEVDALFATASGSTRTDAAGAFRLESLYPGRLAVQVSHPRRLGPWRTILALGDPGSERQDLRLDAGLRVEGFVETYDRKRVPGAKVIIVPKGVRDIGEGALLRSVLTTDADGRFVAEGVRPGEYTIHLDSDSSRLSVEPLDVRAGEPPVLVGPRAYLTTIEGVVLLGNGTPVAGATVAAHVVRGKSGQSYLPQSRTRADGSFAVDVDRRATYALVLQAVGLNGSVRPRRTGDLAAGARGVVITTEPGLAISARVLAGGQPVKSFTVQAIPATRDLTDPRWGEQQKGCGDGRYNTGSLGEGRYFLDVCAASGLRRVVAVEAGAPPIEVRLDEGGGSIRGRVLRADGSPYRGAEVMAESATELGLARCDEQGRYEMRGLVPGLYRVTAGGPRDSSQRRPSLADVEVREGAETGAADLCYPK